MNRNDKVAGLITQKVIIRTPTTNISTSDTILFVGRIDKGVFLHNIKSNVNYFIPTSDIHSIEIAPEKDRPSESKWIIWLEKNRRYNQ
jgi:hypothetical protein